MPIGTRTYIITEPDPIVFEVQLNEVAAALELSEIPLAASGEFIKEDIVRTFATRTSPDGERWADWSEAYSHVAENYPNTGMLRQGDTMYQALIDDDAFTLGADTLTYEPTVPATEKGKDPRGIRAIAHQKGREGSVQGRSAPMPARPFLPMSEQTSQLILGVFKEWFDEAIALFRTSTGRIGMRHQIRGPRGFVSRASVGKAPLPRRR